VFERCGFYHITAGVEQPATPPLLTVQLLGSPSPFYTNSGVTKFNIPLNPILDSAKYQLFVYPNSYPDTLTLVYTSQPFTVNPDCGSIYIHNLTRLSLTKHHLDSAIIVNNMINTTSGENIKIYL
jgi:hypothetical protein